MKIIYYIKKKLNKNNKNFKIKKIEEDGITFLLYKIPQTFDILQFLNKLHGEDSHRGINSLRHYITQRNFYIDGATSLSKYIINNCLTCLEKRNKLISKRSPSKQILTFYPKQRYVMDITELPIEINKERKYYLFCIIDHFSKYGMAYLIENKEAFTILKYLKISFECNGFPEELGSDNGREFKNKTIENYLMENDIKFVHGAPYNPHSQGVVERFHQTLKDLLYGIYTENCKSFDLKESLEIALKKYNNHIHSTIKYKPNEIFYSNSEELFNEVLANMKKSFERVSSEYSLFKLNEKCLLNGKIKIQKKYTKKNAGLLIYDKIRNKKVYTKINVIIKEINSSNIQISIAKDYLDFNLKNKELYYVSRKLLFKCTEGIWESNLKNKNDLEQNIIDNNDYISANEEDFINTHKDELNN